MPAVGLAVGAGPGGVVMGRGGAPTDSRRTGHAADRGPGSSGLPRTSRPPPTRGPNSPGLPRTGRPPTRTGLPRAERPPTRTGLPRAERPPARTGLPRAGWP
ncbi:hypothetical protein ACH4HG_24785, partial [Streptomyces coeruleorubidus]